MNDRQLSSTTHPMTFYMVLSSDHVTPATGKTVAGTISKDGGVFAAAAGAITETGNGWYALAGNATDRNTLGDLDLVATATGCDQGGGRFTIVGGDPFNAASGGLTNLDAAVSSRMATFTLPANFSTLTIDAVSGGVTVKTNVDKSGYSITQAFPTNFGSLSIDAGTGGIVVKTNNDKAGYSLTVAPPTTSQIAAALLLTPANLIKTDAGNNVSIAQAFPTNFSTLAISGAGVVNAATLTNADKSGYALTQAFPANFASTVISPAGVVNVNLVDWLGVAPAALNGGTVQATASLGATAPAGWINSAAFATGATLPAVTSVTNAANANLVSVNGIANYNGIAWSDILLYAGADTTGLTSGIAPGATVLKFYKPGDTTAAAHFVTVTLDANGNRISTIFS